MLNNFQNIKLFVNDIFKNNDYFVLIMFAMPHLLKEISYIFRGRTSKADGIEETNNILLRTMIYNLTVAQKDCHQITRTSLELVAVTK
jgi:hypothetical protein